MDYDWLYERLLPYYRHNNGRPGTDPVVLIQMVPIQHLFGIPSLRQTYCEIQVNLAYCWFLGYGLLDETPHFAMVSYAFRNRFPEELGSEILEDGKIPILPYTRYKGRKDRYKPWDYEYDPVNDRYICPQGGALRHTAASKEGKRACRSTPRNCKACPCKSLCGANEKGQKVLTTHIWQEYLDIVEQLRKTERGKELYAMRKQTIERVFADAKEEHAMRYTHHRGLTRVTHGAKLKFAAIKLKNRLWSWNTPPLSSFFAVFFLFYTRTAVLAC